MLLVVGYVVGPMRLAMGSVPLWQTLLSLGLALATVPLLVAVAGRIDRNGVVRTGARVGLREAMRG